MVSGLRRLIVLLLAIAALTGAVLTEAARAADAEGGGWGPANAVRRWIAQTIEKAVSGPDLQVRIGTIGGAVPVNFTISDVTVADREGVWLRLEGLRVNLAPTALLTGLAKADAIEAQRVIVERAPVPAAEPEPPPADRGPVSLLPDLPVGIAVDKLAIAELLLAEPLLGQEARLKIDGSLDLASGGSSLEAHLNVDRLGEQPGTVALDVAFNPDDKRLDLNLKASEPAGGLIATALNIPGTPPVNASLDGQGTLDDWKGTFTATAENAARLAADATVQAVPEGHAVTVAATGDVASLLGPDIAPLAGLQPVLKGIVVIAPDGALTLQPVAVETAAATASLSGRVGADRRSLDLRYEVQAGPDSTLRGLAPGIAWREGTVSGTAQGTLDALTVAVEGLIRDLAADDPALAPALASVIGPEVRLDGRALVNADTGDVGIEGVNLTTAAASAGAQGGVRGWGRTADVTVSLNADDLSRLSGLAGRPLAGSLALAGPVRRQEDGTVTAGLSGALRGLETGTPADGVLGRDVTLAAQAVMEPGGAMRVTDLTVDGQNGRLTGGAALVDGAVDARTRLEIADLAPVGTAAGTEMAGALTLDATAKGPLDALAAEAVLQARNFAVQGRRFGETRLNATAQNLPGAPQGRLSARTELAGAGLTADAAYALEGQALRISDLALANGPNRITGAVRVALDAMTATGKLDGNLPQLQALSELAGVPLNGAAGFTVALDAPNGKQAANLTANASNLRVDGEGGPVFAARRLTANADVADALGNASGKARLELQDGAAAGKDLSRVTANVDGSLAKAAFRAEAAGAGRDPLGLELAGEFTQNGTLNRVRLDRLQGRYDGESFRLTQPAAIALGDRRYEVSGLRLVSGNAQLAADLGLNGERLSGELRLDRVPMALARLADPSLRLDGTLNAQATLGGTVRRPQADATVRIANLKAQQTSQAGLPGLNATVNARWREARLTVDGDAATGNNAGRLTLNAAAPLAMDPETLAFSVPERGRLEAALRGAIDASLANDLLAASGDRARGTLRLDVSVDGTVAAPRLGGTVTLANGRYENRATGAIISNIDARIVGDGDVFTIQTFRGRTVNGGEISARGVIRPAAADPQQQLDLTIQADRARLVQNDLAAVTIGTNLTLTGSFLNPRLAGPVRIERAEIQIPNQIPPNVVDLKVVEVGKGRKAQPVSLKNGQAGDGQAAAPEPAFAMILDLTVSAQNQIFVRGRGLDAEFAAQLAVTGTSSQPLVNGRVSMLRGELDLLAKTFTFKRGVIEFDGGPTIDPRLDFLAEATANDVTAQVLVTGTASQPKLEVTSPQGLPQDEVLSAVLFGKSVADLSAVEAVQLAQSAATLAGFGGGGPGLIGNLRRSLGIDRLEFVSGADGRGGAVEAGRYVSDRVYVGVEQGIGANQSRATVEVDITKNIKAQADVGADSETRVGVKWELNY